MKKTVQPIDRQSLLDVAIQTSGGVEAAVEMSVKNDLSITDTLPDGVPIDTVAPVDKNVLARYEARDVRPATDLSAEDLATAPYGGIGYMGIEVDFIVS